jgi:hypothetical protein
MAAVGCHTGPKPYDRDEALLVSFPGAFCVLAPGAMAFWHMAYHQISSCNPPSSSTDHLLDVSRCPNVEQVGKAPAPLGMEVGARLAKVSGTARAGDVLGSQAGLVQAFDSEGGTTMHDAIGWRTQGLARDDTWDCTPVDRRIRYLPRCTGCPGGKCVCLSARVSKNSLEK